MGFFKQDPKPASFAGFELRCEICKHTAFFEREVQLHGSAATIFGLEWTGPSAKCFVCARCGYIHWFLPQKQAPA